MSVSACIEGDGSNEPQEEMAVVPVLAAQEPNRTQRHVFVHSINVSHVFLIFFYHETCGNGEVLGGLFDPASDRLHTMHDVHSVE